MNPTTIKALLYWSICIVFGADIAMYYGEHWFTGAWIGAAIGSAIFAATMTDSPLYKSHMDRIKGENK